MEEEIKLLIQECKNGSIGSFERIVELHKGIVSNTIYQMLGSGHKSDTDDLAQEVFIKIYNNLKNFREEAKFSTWAYRIAVNTVWDHLRKQKTRKTVPLDDINPPSAEKPRGDKELDKLMAEEIQRLPEKFRIIIILKDMENMPYKDIAETLKCRIGTVESRLFRARSALKENLKKTPWWRDYI